jgi:hypothetical protein
MTIAELIQTRLDETGQSKSAAARDIEITRPTLETWLRGAAPEPESPRTRRLAFWLGISEAELLVLIWLGQGIDLTVLEGVTGATRRVAKNLVRNL